MLGYSRETALQGAL